MTEHTVPIRTEDEDSVPVGSRKSELAMKQTELVIEKLKEKHLDKKFHIAGDKNLLTALPKMVSGSDGGKGLFTKELETALVEGKVDFVVHSLKDLPTTLPEGLVIGAVLIRDEPEDALILNEKYKGENLSSLPPNTVIGTSSLRRRAQLLSKYPHLKIDNIRGNLNTRLKHLQNDQKKNMYGGISVGEEKKTYGGIILAKAGLVRMEWEKKIAETFPGSEMMYAVGQGALAVECKAEDLQTLELLSKLHDKDTALRVVAERSFLFSLGGGCSAPVGVVSDLHDGNVLELEGSVWSLNGKENRRKKLSCKLVDISDEPPRKKPVQSKNNTFCGIVGPVADIEHYETAFQLGKNLAEALLDEGAKGILDEARNAAQTLDDEVANDTSNKARNANGRSQPSPCNV